MKNFLLFNQSFGTEGSPNQTGETQTRENRIGLMSYLRRTLMLLFAVLVMSMANVGQAWGADCILYANSSGSTPSGTNSSYTGITATFNSFKDGTYTIGTNDQGFTNNPHRFGGNGSGKNVTIVISAGYQAVITVYGQAGSTNKYMAVKTSDVAASSSDTYNTKLAATSTVYKLQTGTLSAGTYYVKSDGDGVALVQLEATVTPASSGKNIYLKPNGIWNTADPAARFAAYYYKSAGDGNGWVDFTSYNACTPCFKATIPSGYDKVILCRMDGSKAANNWDNRWNQTANQNVPTGNDTCWTISNIDGSGSWGTYTAPTFTISFNGNGSTGGSTSSHTGIACDGSQTLRANGFSRTGWTFTGWNTSAYGDGDAYAAGATISSITSDITLYAQWSKVMYVRATGDLSWWYNDNARFAVWVANAGETKDAWVDMTKAENCSDPAVYKATVPGNGYTKVAFVRMDPAKPANNWDNKWNHTSKESMPTSNNQFTITGGSGDNCTGSWGTYSAPTLTVTYNDNGSTGGSVPTDGSSPYACGSTVTVLGNTGSLVKTGYTFAGWNTAAGGGGDAYAAAETFTISANTTLYAQWEAAKYTVTYNVNGGGSVTPTSATQASSGASVTLPTPTWSGYTFEGWYNAGTKIGNAGATYTPTADITLYAHWTDNISGKVFSFIDNNYGDKFKAFDLSGWVTGNANNKDKTHTNATTGVSYVIDDATWENKSMAVAALAKFIGGTTKMSVVIPTGKIATVKISYGAYGTGASDYSLTVNGTSQTNPSTKLTNDMTNAQVIASMKEITLSSQTGTLTLGISNTSKSLYVGRVSAVITGYTVSYAAGTYGSGSLASGTKTAGSSFTLSSSSSAFTRSGYVYDGWSINEDGSTKDYNLGGSYTTDAAITLYPHWVADCVAPATVNVTATVNEVSGYWFYPDDDVVLTAAPTGSPAGSPVTYQWKKNGADIDGATSSTYTIDDAAASDAGKYTCTISYGACSTTSSDFELKCMQFYLKNSGGGDISNHVLVKEDATHASLTLELTGGTTYKFRVTDGCGNWYGNTGEMTSSSCTNWTMPHDADCRVTTNSTTGDYTFLFDFTDGLLGSEMKVSVVYPGGDQAADKVIYWDNSVLNWAAGNQWYRIGTKTGNTKTQMTLVPGTANLYKVTTGEYNGFQNWHIANNQGEGTGNVFWTKDSDPATNEEITAAMAYDGVAVTSVVTVTPTTTHATGETSDNNNCQFYTYSKMYVMKTDAVSITAPSNGTITVAYTDVAGASQSFTSGSENLAHTVIITPTATPATGYDLGGLTVNAVAHTSGNTYTCSGATVVAATFTPHVYTITLNKGDHGASNQSASVAYLDDELTSITHVTSTGYTLTGYYDGSTKVLNADGSFAASTVSGYITDGVWTKTANATLTAKWEAMTTTLTFDANTTYHGTTGDGGATATYDATALASVTHTTPAAGYQLDGYYTTATGEGTKIVTASGTLVASTSYTTAGGAWHSELANLTLYARYTDKSYSVTHTFTNASRSSGGEAGASAATHGTDYSVVVAATSGYTLPSTITVTIGGETATAGTEYTWTKGTGTVTIGGSYITGDIVITVSGTADCPSSASGETVYKFVTKSSDLGTGNVCAVASTEYPQTTSNSLSTLTGGTLKAYGTGSLGQLTFNEDCYKLAGSDNTWLIVELDCAIATGDVIRYVNYASSGNTVMIETTRGTSTSIVMDGNGTMMEQTIVAPAALIGVKTLYLTRKAGTAFLTSFEILRPYTVTLNASTNGGKVGGNNTATMYFKDSESQALPHAFKSSNYFTGWFEDDDSGDAVDNPYTATGTGTLYAQFDACASQTGSLYKFAVKNTLTAGSPFTTSTDGNASMTVGNYLSSLYGGTLDVHGRKTYLTNTTSAFTLTNNSAYLLVTLDCPLQAGDQIKSIISNNSVAITTSSSRSTTNTLATGTNTITIPDGFAGKTTLYIWRNSANGDISYLEIIRPNGVTITGAVSPDGYGTVSPASIFVASGSTVSLASNVLTCDGKTLTATPTAATAEYTYAFSSWSGVTNGGTVSVATTATANFTRTANNYTLAWSSNGGSELSGDYTSGSTAYGASITAPNDPTLSNYTFDGWKTNNDGTGDDVAATMPAEDVTYYAAWKQTVTLMTGAQGSGDNQTPYVYLNGTGVSSFTPHTASGYTLQGYYTAGSGGVKVLSADGTFAAANVTDYITSSKWSRTGAAPTLYAQWVASEDCSTSDFVIRKGDATEYQGCMESSSYNGTATSFTAGSPTTVGNAKMTISNYSDGAIKRPGSGNTFSIVIEPVSGYYLKSVCWAGKVEDDETVSYYWDDNSGSAITISPTTTSGTGVTYNAPSSTTKFTASYTDDGDGSGGIWWRNVQVEVCAGGGTTYSVTYDDNDATGGTAPTDATNYSYGGTVTVKGNTGSLEKTNYTFAGWTTNNNGTGSSYEAGSTFSITANTTLYAKWTQAVTFDANTANHGSTGGSATAVWNATGLTGITHATPASGYKLLGYYTAPTSGTKVLNSDGSFAATAVDGYVTDGKWSRTGTAPTLYAQYESAGALTWNLIVNSDTTNLSTSTKTSAFTEISTTNMTDAALTGLTYSKGKKSSLTGKISTPDSYNADKYVYVTFQVASGYKFTPSSISVKVQPVGENEHKAVELSLADATNTLASSSATKCDGTEKGKTTTVTLAGDGTYFTGTVTLKIYVYPHAEASAANYNCYRLGTPITIEGEIEEACGTMPSYTSMSYTTTTFAPGADASGSPITIVGGDNINTYQWKYNTINDRTSGTNCGTGTSLTPLTDASATIDGTRYYWCEMTNDACGITIKSPAVAITVAAAKSDATVTWTDPATPNYGGGGYTIKATVNTEWDGNAADLVITAPAGIRIYNVSSGTDGSSRKYVQADFDVQTSFDRTTYASNIPFTVSAAATATYNAISDDHNTAYSACAGAGEGSSYNIRMRKTVTKDGNYYHCANTDGWISPNISSSYSTGKAGTTMAPFDTVASSNTQYVWVRTYHANIKKVRIYADFRADNMTVSNVYKHTDYFTANSKYEVDYSVIYNDDEENSDLGDAAQGYVDITLSDVMMSANDILLVSFSTNRVRPLGAVITESSAGSLNTHLQWSGGLANNAAVGKYTTDAYFTYSASMITENTNSLGAITYSSSAPSVATVDATGKVAMVAAGTTTIKATLAASGCYKKAEISYTLNVTEVPCAITAGTLTLTSGTESKCSSANVTLTLTGFESGASIQWKDGDTDINNGGNYTIATDNTTSTSTLTTDQPGTYSVMVTSDCSVRSNRITISNISATASVTKIVDEWYVKNGRLTPDIELWSLSEGATLKSVAWSPTNETGLSCVARGGVIYLEGKSPSSNDSGDIEYTLTATITDECKADHEETTKTIKITHQKNTDKHVLAFVVNGTAKGGFTEGITAAQTTSVGLYNAIAAQFDVQTTNIYATDDEKKLKEYYSQYDILCITDYPNTQTKGANSKSYVDAIGSLIDIRPILTMEAFVSKLANWKAKGISGNPSSPTTRQYTMLLQCKDHEIFAGTELTKVGEGDETMYRVSMVCDTLEDYKTLDATYGATLPHKEKESKSGAGDGEYNYGGKPALQGFTFTQEMSDNDLLPIGLIDDGAGNPLQVGIERQHNMEARLMVLGINSYAMERLTDDGERVVINALNYLMKKNAEDIADCSTSFVGGAEGEEKNWNNKDNWTGNTVPLPSQKVRILAECEVSSTVYALDVLIVTDGKYNHGSDNAAGKLTIKENGALIVGGKIQAASAPAYNRPRATTPDRLLIETSSTNQAALIFDNEEAETQATVNLYSLGSKPSSYQYQYFAVPMEVVPVNPVFANETHGGTGIYTYVYSEATSGWTRRKYYDDLFAFEGLGITTKSTGAMNYEMTGNLASTATKEITLTHADKGLNLIGNSWMAPIQIGALAEDNADLDNKTAYIYCAGRDAEGGAVVSSDDTETAGQWLAVPFEAAEFETWKATGKLSVIPAMQAFQIKVDAEATLTLDYDKVVRGSTNDLNAKLRAPGRRMAANEVTMTNIRVADSKTHTDLSLFEGDRFSEAFDNGWEAEYMNGDGRSAKLYAETEAGQMAVAAMYDYEGTVVGFAPGQETEYTFSFMGEDNGYYLNDIKLQNSVRISEGETYTFTYEEGDAANRFYISRTAINAPEVTTGMENLDAAAPRVQKIIYNDKLYIIRGGRLYDATGKVVK